MTVRLLPCGDAALLVELDRLEDVLALHAALEADPVDGVDDVVPAARTLLLRLDPARTTLRDVAARLTRTALADRPRADHHDHRNHDHGARGANEVVELPVRYDGPDLDEIAAITGLGREGVVAAHTAATWTVAFCGFAPGFGYLVGDEPRLAVPRREVPRTRVPSGAVGLAGEFTGVYPRESPGGWQLLGQTGARVWDLDRDPPALLRPGVHVRFVAVP